MELLERTRPLEDLGRLLIEAGSGQGRLVLVAGEAGVGKTSLLRRFTSSLPGRVRALWGGCDPLPLPRPLGPLLDVVPRLGEFYSRLLEGEVSRARLFAAVRDALQAVTHVLVFEDVHWADDASLDLLRYLGRRMHTTRSLLVATYREDEAGHALRAVLGGLATSECVARVALQPLTPEGVAILARGSGIDAGELYRRSGGNPFLVTELLGAGGGARNSPPAARALEAAAVIGARFDPLLLQEVAGADAAGVEECLASGALIREGADLAFRHELAREAILRATLPARSGALHAQALAARRRSPARPDDEAILAHHAEAAGDGAAVLELAPAAARRAAALGSHREAAGQYARALRFADALAPAERARLLEARSHECSLSDQIADAIGARQAALDLWRALGAREELGTSHRWLSRLSWLQGRRAEAEHHAREALAALEPAGPSRELAWALSNQSQLDGLAGRAGPAVAWGERAIALARTLGDREIVAHALNNVGAARTRAGESGAGIPLMEQGLALSLELGIEEHVALAYANLGSTAVDTRQLAAAQRQLQAGLGYCTEHDLDSWRLRMTGWLAVCELWKGRYPEAARIATDALEHPSLAGPDRVQPLIVLGRVRARCGEAGAGPLLDEALALASQTGEMPRIGPVRAARAEAAWLLGDLERAGDEARAAFEAALSGSEPWMLGELAFWLWRAGSLAASPENAAIPYALQIGGRAREAAAWWRALGCPYEAALAAADLEDEAALRDARESLEALGARPLADTLARRLRERGVRDLPRRPRQSTRANPAGLTGRQLEVLRLVAEGLRNAEIADRLCVSPKTVDHHVSALLSKLGARSRSEAAGRAADILRGTEGGGAK